MVNRLVLDINGMRVSKPGINVLTATGDDNFLFHSDWPSAGIHMKGTTSINGVGTVSINYGKTYTKSPLVICSFSWGAAGGNFVFPGPTEPPSISEAISPHFAVRSTLTQAIFFSNKSGNHTIRYTVWDLEIG